MLITVTTMTDVSVFLQVFTFILAGNETSSVSLAWTLYELAKNPHIQDKLRREVKEAFSDEEELAWEKLEKLQFLENVIKESLRLHPPGDVTGRVTLSDVEIGGYFVPRGTMIIFPIDAVQRSSHCWANPELFDPQRFEENGMLLATNLLQYKFVCVQQTMLTVCFRGSRELRMFLQLYFKNNAQYIHILSSY